MNLAATTSCPTKSPVRRSAEVPLHPSSVTIQPSATPRSPQTPSLPDARPGSDRFRCGGRESNFLAIAAAAESRILAATCLMLAFFASLTARSNAAVIFSDVDPALTNIFSLAEPIAGAFEDTNNNNTGAKLIHGWGIVVNITTSSTLRTAIAPFNVGASAGLRLDVFQLPPPPYSNRSGTVTTTNFLHLGSSASVESLAGGRQWITFAFDPGIPLSAGTSYLLRSSTDQTLTDPASQAHYWLSIGTPTGWIVDSRVIPSNSSVPEETFGTSGETRGQSGLAGAIYLSDTPAVIPEPATFSVLLMGAAMLSFVRRRNGSQAA